MQFLVKILIRTEFLLEPDISSFEVLWYQWYSSFAVCMEEDCFLLLVSPSDQCSFEGTESKTLWEPFKWVIYLNLNRKRAKSVPSRRAGEPESRRAGGEGQRAGEPDPTTGVYPRGRSPSILLEKLGTDCDDRKRKYSLPRIFSARVGTSLYRHPPTDPLVVLQSCGIDGERCCSRQFLDRAI